MDDWAAKIRGGRCARPRPRRDGDREPRPEALRRCSRNCSRMPGARASSASPGRPAPARARWWMPWRARFASRARPSAIIAVDPTSPFSGGAILGDRIRMQAHHADPGVFIRSMATRGCAGRAGARDHGHGAAAGRRRQDCVLIETVGVGQDEVEIARLARRDRGGAGARHGRRRAGASRPASWRSPTCSSSTRPTSRAPIGVEREIKAMLSLSTRADGWTPPIVRTVATEGKGIAKRWRRSASFHAVGRNSKRAAGIVATQVTARCCGSGSLERLPQAELESAAEAVAARRRDPYSIVDEWLKRI